ncbi:dual specificity protein phosphatase MPK-4 [Lucilia sericata]|uniref:dual specificity protein phosphatase MPK-4 n=1 Tax=Lucilia sericata TaxID=13632 RepID=UPI0018A84D45|nr:dual specificity protein phosphatase MPK-4 [Lucilia sericata]
MATSTKNENTATKSPNTIVAKQKLQDSGVLTREDFDGGPVSLDEIENGLYLGNLTAATNMETLRSFNITHILTLDSVPLPKHITEASFLTTKYIHISDMPKEDILHHLNTCVDFITSALSKGNNILVHCYFGVSRSSSAVIAYIMKQHNMDYQAAYDYVKAKRRFVQPNIGFIAQLKLWRRMGCSIDPQYQKYKIYRLRLAGEQVRKAKILPQNFNNLIKPDPAITQENPEPIVYRCRKCRRVLASKSHVLLHPPKNQTLSKGTNGNANNTAALPAVEQNSSSGTPPRLLEQIAAQIRKVSITSPTDGQQPLVETDKQQYCQNILFVEPIAWMQHISNNTQGRLNCPKCEQKLGNYSWINGCQCPCGEEISPAFYLIPSKVELSKAVQNVQTTL